MFINYQCKKHTQKGNTLLELTVVMVLISFLSSVAYFSYSSSVENIKAHQAVQNLSKDFYDALKACLKRSPKLDKCNATTMIELSPLIDQKTPWGDTWTSTPGPGETNVIVTYPFKNAGSAAVVTGLIEDLIQRLHRKNHTCAKKNSRGDAIIVDYIMGGGVLVCT